MTTIFRTKPVDDVLHQNDDQPRQGGLRRRLSTFDLIGFGVGIVIGTGIFTLTGVEAKQHAGPAIVLSFVLAGIVSLLAAMCYAELASAVPTAGSAYSYAYATVGEIVAWIIGWDLLLEFVLGASVVSRGWSGYLQSLFGLPTSIFGESSVVNVGAIAIVAVLTVVAVTGIKQSAWLTNALVFVKVAICLFVIIAGLFFLKRRNLTPFVPPRAPGAPGGGLDRPVVNALFGSPSAFGIAGVLTAAAVVFFAYTGFEAVANLAEESQQARAGHAARAARHARHRHRALRRRLVRADRHAEVHRDQRRFAAVGRVRLGRRQLGRHADRHRGRVRADVGDPGRARRHRAHRLRHGPRPADPAGGGEVSARTGTPVRFTSARRC